MKIFKLASSARASFYLYNTKEEIDRFVEILKELDQTLMSTVADYVSRIEGTCGAESDVIVNFKYEKKDEAISEHNEESHTQEHDCRHNFRVNL